jgi:Nitroreductase family
MVMQTWEAITSRRNVRTFADRPVAAADLDQILEAGRRSPSSQNWQPWDFILVTQREQLRELAKVWRGAGHVAQSAATIVVVGPPADNEFHRAQFDLGQATMAMTLAAADLGIGSCHAGWPTSSWPANCWAFPRIAAGPSSCHSVTPLTGRWRPSRPPGGGPSARSSTVTTGPDGRRHRQSVQVIGTRI